MGQRLWTAAELERISPTERRAIFDERVVTELDDAPAELVARTRARVERTIVETTDSG